MNEATDKKLEEKDGGVTGEVIKVNNEVAKVNDFVLENGKVYGPGQYFKPKNKCEPKAKENNKAYIRRQSKLNK